MISRVGRGQIRCRGQRRARAWLILALVLLIAVLLFYKLAGPICRSLFLTNADDLEVGGGATTGTAAAILAYVPRHILASHLGISFYIFR